MKVKRAVGFMRPRVGLIFFVTDNLFAVNIYYHKSCYLICTINPIGKWNKNPDNNEDRSKYLLDEVLEKFNQTLSVHIIKNNETIFLLHILWYFGRIMS